MSRSNRSALVRRSCSGDGQTPRSGAVLAAQAFFRVQGRLGFNASRLGCVATGVDRSRLVLRDGTLLPGYGSQSLGPLEQVLDAHEDNGQEE